MTRREMLLEKRRQKALEREAMALANSPKSNEEEDLGKLDDESLQELENLTGAGEIDNHEGNTEDNEIPQKKVTRDTAREEAAALKIQKMQRGKAAREQRKKQQTAAIKIQAAARGRVERSIAVQRTNQRKKHFSNVYNGAREMEGTLQYLFSKIDTHKHGYITKKDIMKAMRNSEIVRLIENCPPLQPLLRPRSYKETFHAMDTNHDGSVEYEELRMFCAGMYSIDASNDIAVKMDLALHSLTTGYIPSDGDEEGRNRAQEDQDNLNEVLHQIFIELHAHEVQDDTSKQNNNAVVKATEKVTKIELLRGLHRPEVREKIRNCPPLVPLLKPRAFWATLMAIDTDHDGNISYDEVRGFCAGVLTAQTSLVHEVKESAQSNHKIKETLKTFFSVANFSIGEQLKFSTVCDALDDTYTLAEISKLSPIPELQEEDGNSFTSLKNCLLEAKFAQDRLNYTHDLYVNGSKNRSNSDVKNEDVDADSLLVSFKELELYCCGLCAAKRATKNGRLRKQFPDDSLEYNLIKALNVLYTLLRVPKRKD